MLVIPDPSTAWIDIFNAEPTLSLICTIVDPITREPYDRDPRGIAEKAEAYLKSTGIADTAFVGPEAEFFIFDDVRFSAAANSAFYQIESMEAHWNSAREEFPNLGYKIRAKEGYFPVPPADTLQDIRNEMCLELEKAGVPIERQHHEVATAGQAEIDIRFAPLKEMADHMQYYKYIVRNVARRHNKTVTFMSVMGFANSLMLDFRCLIIPRFVYATGDSFNGDKLTDPKVAKRIGHVAAELVRVTNGVRGK